MSGPEEEPGFECGACNELNRERLLLLKRLEERRDMNTELQAKLDAVRIWNAKAYPLLTSILDGKVVLRNGILVEP